MGKMIWDVGRVIDYLETLPFVDPKKIGCIGHSHGAYGTLFAAAFEPRISTAVASCGFTTFRNDPNPERWSHLTALIPRLGFYLPDVASIPFDWQHVLGLVAPRKLFVWYATKDSIFPKTENLDALLRDVRKVYGPAEDRVELSDDRRNDDDDPNGARLAGQPRGSHDAARRNHQPGHRGGRGPGINPSSYAFLWELFEATADKDFVRLIYGANGASTKGLPYDLFAADPTALEAKVANVIAESGAEIKLLVRTQSPAPARRRFGSTAISFERCALRGQS
jgi:hypothetical protein